MRVFEGLLLAVVRLLLHVRDEELQQFDSEACDLRGRIAANIIISHHQLLLLLLLLELGEEAVLLSVTAAVSTVVVEHD